MPKKRGRPRIDDNHLLEAVADRLVRDHSLSRHAAMNQVVIDDDRNRDSDSIKHTVRRLERKWVDQYEELMASAEAALEHEQTPTQRNSGFAGSPVNYCRIAAEAGLQSVYGTPLQELLSDLCNPLETMGSHFSHIDFASNIAPSVAELLQGYHSPARQVINDQINELTKANAHLDDLAGGGSAMWALDLAGGGSAMRALEDEQERIRRLMPDIDRLSGLPRW